MMEDVESKMEDVVFSECYFTIGSKIRFLIRESETGVMPKKLAM